MKWSRDPSYYCWGIEHDSHLFDYDTYDKSLIFIDNIFATSLQLQRGLWCLCACYMRLLFTFKSFKVGSHLGDFEMVFFNRNIARHSNPIDQINRSSTTAWHFCTMCWQCVTQAWTGRCINGLQNSMDCLVQHFSTYLTNELLPVQRW